jgi:hypothetical protein
MEHVPEGAGDDSEQFCDEETATALFASSGVIASLIGGNKWMIHDLTGVVKFAVVSPDSPEYVPYDTDYLSCVDDVGVMISTSLERLQGLVMEVTVVTENQECRVTELNVFQEAHYPYCVTFRVDAQDNLDAVVPPTPLGSPTYKEARAVAANLLQNTFDVAVLASLQPIFPDAN